MASRAATSASSRSRPTKLVSCRGRVWGGAGGPDGGRAAPRGRGRAGGRPAATNAPAASSARPRACARRCAVPRRGQLSASSRAWTVRTPTPARSASASWVRPAARRRRRRWAAKPAGPPGAARGGVRAGASRIRVPPSWPAPGGPPAVSHGPDARGAYPRSRRRRADSAGRRRGSAWARRPGRPHCPLGAPAAGPRPRRPRRRRPCPRHRSPLTRSAGAPGGPRAPDTGRAGPPWPWSSACWGPRRGAPRRTRAPPGPGPVLYVATSGDGTVARLDAGTGRPLGPPLPAGPLPWQLARGADGSLLALSASPAAARPLTHLGRAGDGVGGAARGAARAGPRGPPRRRRRALRGGGRPGAGGAGAGPRRRAARLPADARRRPRRRRRGHGGRSAAPTTW